MSGLSNGGSFRQNVAIVSFGNILSYLLGFIFTPFLTRIYPPEVYGLFAVFNALMVNLSVVGTLGYEQGILIQKSRADYISMVNVNIIVSTIFCLLLFTLLIIDYQHIGRILNVEPAASWLFILPGIILLNILGQIATTVSIKNGNFKLSTSARLASMFFSKAYAVFHGKVIGPLVSGFLISEIMGRVTFLLTYGLSKKNLLYFYLSIKNIFSKSILIFAKTNKQYPFFTLPSILLNTISYQLPVYLITGAHGATIVGYYALANTLLTIPITLVSRSIGTVFSQRASELFNSSQGEVLLQLIRKIVKSVMMLTVPPLVLILFFGEEIFAFLLGDQWVMAGIFAKYMVIYFSFEMLATPFAYLYLIFRIEKRLLTVSAIGFVFVLGCLLIGTFRETPEQMILWLSLGKILDNTLRIVGLYPVLRTLKNK